MAITRYWMVLAAVLLAQSAMAHMSLLYPMARGSVGDKRQFDFEAHAFIGYNHKRTLPCNGYNQVGPITKLKAGQIVNWPVPDNAPSCKEKGKCLFVWSWIAVNVPQFYINCADVEIDGVDNGKWSRNKGIQIVDAPEHPQNVVKPGDDAGDRMGKGPHRDDIERNLKGNWN
ncbi:hypothetical protein BGZ91_006384 [Linnemannia elongata]|nr:hypothetical protein BGZ91_006384 [Linnemannia elongata]